MKVSEGDGHGTDEITQKIDGVYTSRDEANKHAKKLYFSECYDDRNEDDYKIPQRRRYLFNESDDENEYGGHYAKVHVYVERHKLLSKYVK